MSGITDTIGSYLQKLGNGAVNLEKTGFGLDGQELSNLGHNAGVLGQLAGNVASWYNKSPLVSPQDDPDASNFTQSTNLDQYGYALNRKQPTSQDMATIEANQLKQDVDLPYQQAPQPTNTPTQPNTLASTISNQQTQLPPSNGTFFTNGWTPKYASLWEKYAPKAGITPDMVKVLVTSENGKEDPGYPNTNGNGTVDVGLTQLNVPATDTQTIERLKNPETNVQEGVKRLAARMNYLGDPVLALASWNLGPGGAISNPQAALQRAQTIYRNAGIPLPQTAFTQNPSGFIAQNMNKYKQLGLVQ